MGLDVEEQQRERNRLPRQADAGECAGKAEAMQQPERERHQPGIPVQQAVIPLAAIHRTTRELRCEEQDAERDHGFHRRPLYFDEAQRCRAERDAVGHCKRSDREDQPLDAVDDQQQRVAGELVAVLTNPPVVSSTVD